MPTIPQIPDLTSYRAVHRAVRLGARRLAAACDSVAGSDADRIAALRRYWRGYRTEVLLHHTVEDDVFFPALAVRCASMRQLMQQLDADHHLLDEQMDEADQAIARLDVLPGPARAARALAALADTMDRHLDLEDEQVLPLFARHFTGAEYHALEQRAMKSLGIGRQAVFTVPFVLAELDEAERADALRSAPLPLKVLHRFTRERHARLAATVFGEVLLDEQRPAEVAV